MIRSFIKSSVWVVAGNFIVKFANLFSVALLARLLGANSLGVYNIINSFAQSVYGITSLGVDLVFQRSSSRCEELGKARVGNVYAVGLVMNIGIVLSSLVLFWLFDDWFYTFLIKKPGYETAYYLSFIVIVLQPVTNFPLLLLTGLKKFKSYSLRNLLSSLISLLFCVGLTYLWGFEGAILGLVLSWAINACIALGTFFYTLRQEQIPLSLNHFFERVREALHEGVPYYLGNVMAGSLASLLVIGMLTRNVSLAEIGYLRAAQSLTTVLSFIPNTITPITISYLSSLGGQADEAQRLKSLQVRSTTILSLLAITGMSYFIRPISALLFGADFVPGSTFYILYMGYTFLAIVNGLFVNFTIADGKSGKTALISILSVALYLLLAWLLIPRLKLEGYALAYIMAFMLSVSWMMREDFKTTRYKEKDMAIFRRLLLLALGSLLLLAIPVYISNIYMLAGAGLAHMALLSLLAAALIFSRDEKQKILAVLLNKLR